MERKSFVFYASWLDAVENLPKDMQGDALLAIAKYGARGEEAAGMKPVAKAMLMMVKAQIDANNARYASGCKGAEFGRLGGRPRKNPSKTPAEPQGNPKETPRKPLMNMIDDNDVSSIDDTKKRKLTLSKKVVAVGDVLAGFEAFWQAYPGRRKVAKHLCREKWKTHKLEEIAPRIVAAVRRLAASPDWTKDDGQFVPMPATFLNQRRWEDVPMEELEESDFSENPAHGAAGGRELDAEATKQAKIEQWNAIYGDLPDDERPKCPYV